MANYQPPTLYALFYTINLNLTSLTATSCLQIGQTNIVVGSLPCQKNSYVLIYYLIRITCPLRAPCIHGVNASMTIVQKNIFKILSLKYSTNVLTVLMRRNQRI